MENEGQTAHFRWSGTFRALHQRNFRLFWVGQLIAITGTRLQVTALNWLIYQLTDSPLMLGLANFVALLPVGLLTPIGGVISDYFPSRKLLLIASVTRILQALTLAALALNLCFFDRFCCGRGLF